MARRGELQPTVPVLHDRVPVLRRHVDHCRTSTATCR